MLQILLVLCISVNLVKANDVIISNETNSNNIKELNTTVLPNLHTFLTKSEQELPAVKGNLTVEISTKKDEVILLSTKVKSAEETLKIYRNQLEEVNNIKIREEVNGTKTSNVTEYRETVKRWNKLIKKTTKANERVKRMKERIVTLNKDVEELEKKIKVVEVEYKIRNDKTKKLIESIHYLMNESNTTDSDLAKMNSTLAVAVDEDLKNDIKREIVRVERVQQQIRTKIAEVLKVVNQMTEEHKAAMILKQTAFEKLQKLKTEKDNFVKLIDTKREEMEAIMNKNKTAMSSIEIAQDEAQLKSMRKEMKNIRVSVNDRKKKIEEAQKNIRKIERTYLNKIKEILSSFELFEMNKNKMTVEELGERQKNLEMRKLRLDSVLVLENRKNARQIRQRVEIMKKSMSDNQKRLERMNKDLFNFDTEENKQERETIEEEIKKTEMNRYEIIKIKAEQNALFERIKSSLDATEKAKLLKEYNKMTTQGSRLIEMNKKYKEDYEMYKLNKNNKVQLLLMLTHSQKRVVRQEIEELQEKLAFYKKNTTQENYNKLRESIMEVIEEKKKEQKRIEDDEKKTMREGMILQQETNDMMKKINEKDYQKRLELLKELKATKKSISQMNKKNSEEVKEVQEILAGNKEMIENEIKEKTKRLSNKYNENNYVSLNVHLKKIMKQMQHVLKLKSDLYELEKQMKDSSKSREDMLNSVIVGSERVQLNQRVDDIRASRGMIQIKMRQLEDKILIKQRKLGYKGSFIIGMFEDLIERSKQRLEDKNKEYKSMNVNEERISEMSMDKQNEVSMMKEEIKKMNEGLNEMLASYKDFQVLSNQVKNINIAEIEKEDSNEFNKQNKCASCQNIASKLLTVRGYTILSPVQSIGMINRYCSEQRNSAKCYYNLIKLSSVIYDKGMNPLNACMKVKAC